MKWRQMKCVNEVQKCVCKIVICNVHNLEKCVMYICNIDQNVPNYCSSYMILKKDIINITFKMYICYGHSETYI